MSFFFVVPCPSFPYSFALAFPCLHAVPPPHKKKQQCTATVFFQKNNVPLLVGGRRAISVETKRKGVGGTGPERAASSSRPLSSRQVAGAVPPSCTPIHSTARSLISSRWCVPPIEFARSPTTTDTCIALALWSIVRVAQEHYYDRLEVWWTARPTNKESSKTASYSTNVK
jgi:hypothetical protein